MSKAHDELTVIKITKDNESELRKVKDDLELRLKLKTSLVSLANAAMTLGLPELKKNRGLK